MFTGNIEIKNFIKNIYLALAKKRANFIINVSFYISYNPQNFKH